mgnify:CR=1 FL=1
MRFYLTGVSPPKVGRIRVASLRRREDGPMELDEITYAAADGVGVITLNRPTTLNAISGRVGGT